MSSKNHQITGEVHWIDSIVQILWLALVIAVAIKLPLSASARLIVGLGIIPFLIKLIGNKFKVYKIVDQQLNIEKGVLSRTKVTIPLSKINDLILSQSIFQRLFGAGDITIVTGNDYQTVLKSLKNPAVFLDQLKPNKIGNYR